VLKSLGQWDETDISLHLRSTKKEVEEKVMKMVSGKVSKPISKMYTKILYKSLRY
jgi:hypothetical protein